jgi:hypothetical protein
MPLDAQFHFAKLRAGDGARMPALRQELESGLVPRLDDAGIAVRGVWAGIFGIAGNELIVVTSAPPDLDLRAGVEAVVGAWDGVAVAEQHPIAPTVRPLDSSRLTREGLYVFRYFDMRRGDIDEFISLSLTGWPSFEGADEFDSAPQGLFITEPSEAGADPDRASMLLVTWYDGLASWQRSRQFPEAAREAFRKRGVLTLRSIAYATRLLPP